MRAQAMVICGAGHGCPQKTAKLVHGANHGRTENQEYGIGVGCFARIKQAAQLAVAQGIVDMLARTVDAAEGLFVQQAFQAIMLGHIAQRGHDDMVVINGQVAGLVKRRNLVLAWRGLVVARFHGHAKLVKIPFHFHHAGKHSLGNDSKILVAEFLALGRPGPKERTSGNLDIGPREIEIVVDEKIFLLKAGV